MLGRPPFTLSIAVCMAGDRTRRLGRDSFESLDDGLLAEANSLDVSTKIDMVGPRLFYVDMFVFDPMFN